MALPKCECGKPITLCDRLNCSQSTFIHNPPPMTNDKLPEEISQQIEHDAYKATKRLKEDNDYQKGYSKGIEDGYEQGATAWAKWKVKHDELRKVLQEFVSNHEAGLLPNRFVYDKAIKILNDGTQ